MLVNDLLNLGGVRLECLEVTVLRENLNSIILAIWTSISGTNRVELVHSIHRACRIGQYAMVYVCRHLQYILKSIIRFLEYLPFIGNIRSQVSEHWR